jgi:hypothetical protein
VDVSHALEAATDPSPLTLLHHAAAGPLRESIALAGVVGRTDQYVEYRLATEPISSGGPCFNARWEPVALHQGKSPSWLQWNTRRGIDMRRIADRLGELRSEARARSV